MNDQALLAAVLDELRVLRSEVASLRVPRLAATDYATMARVLPAIRAAVGGRVFALAELVEHATLPTPEARELRAALGPLDAGSTRRMGKLFARAIGVQFEGLVVQQVGSGRDGAEWMIVATFASAKPAPARDAVAPIRSNSGITNDRKR